MARKQPIGSENSATRARLLDAAEQLMREEGYAAVTSRRLGAVAGVRPQLVHYYFPSMEQLFIMLYRRDAERGLAEAAAALAGDDPLAVIWRQSTDSRDTHLHLEFMALANHHKSLHAEMSGHADHFRQLQRAALERQGIADVDTAIVLLAGVGRMIAMGRDGGMRYGHAAAEAFVSAYCAGLRARSAPPGGSTTPQG